MFDLGISFDIELNSTGLSDFQQLEDLMNLKDEIQNKLALQFKQDLTLIASNKLHSTKEQYVNAIEIHDNIVTLDKDSFIVSMVEDGVPEFDMKCLVNKLTKIYTSKGYKYIKDIKINDLVLTHTGEFKKVISLFKEKNQEEYIYKLSAFGGIFQKHKYIYVTKNHPILTNKGWVSIENIYNNKQDYKIIITAENCNYCNKLTESQIDEYIFCCKNCSYKKSNEKRSLNGRYDLTENGRKKISEQTIITNKKLYLEGKHASQKGNGLYNRIKKDIEDGKGWGYGALTDEKLKEYLYLAAVALGKKSRFTDPESKIWPFLKKLGFERQFKFVRNEDKIYKNGLNRKKLYFFDFANEELKICVEINGERFHTLEQDLLKKEEIEKMGWTYISFWSKEIYNDLNSCVEEIDRIVRNHSGEYFFIETEKFLIEKINLLNKSKYSTMYNWKYNLTVEDNHSYIANGIVTHNSGLLNSPKVKTAKNGQRYMAVPINTMKNGKYNWRDQSTGKFKKSTSGVSGIEFRIVSDNSPANSWIFPGYQGNHFVDKALKEFNKHKVDIIISEEMDKVFK